MSVMYDSDDEVTSNIDECEYVIDGIDIDLKTLCQCTGLKDKNGVLIFEGDIVSIDNDEDHDLCVVTVPYTYEVQLNEVNNII